MVHSRLAARPLRPPLTALGVALLTGALLAVLVAPADAANRRVSISDYQWSRASTNIDLGEHVTWHWIGPDTMHSVTGTSANAQGIDSDPGVVNPRHNVGDSFQLSFDQPGTYTFQCKLHSLVRGTVSVSSTPGDPITEVDPIPKNNVDLKAPNLSDVELDRRSFKNGTRIEFGVNERARVVAEFYRRSKKGKRTPRHRRYVGFQRWKATIGFNDGPFVRRAQRFGGKPGRYVAIVRATDTESNESAGKRLRFRLR
ncbi:MAG: cupredoxin domain-containing protein [Solirubrobacterales bacterium]